MATPDLLTEAGFRRRRVKNSCLQCRKSKTKCSGQRPCVRCSKKGLACHFRLSSPASEHHDNVTPDPQTSAENAGLSQNGHAIPSSSSSLTPGEEDSSGSPSAPGIPAWLMSEQLPDRGTIYELVELFFRHVHPVRCNGFIHVPTFMQRLEDGLNHNRQNRRSEPQAILFLVMALAAPFYAAKLDRAVKSEASSSPYQSPLLNNSANKKYYLAGKGWATVAKRVIVGDFNTTTINRLICYVLLYEYLVRTGNHTMAFMISGVIARQMHLLQLNVEFDYDVLCTNSEDGGGLSWPSKESRRRLAWACFLIDAFIECGADELRYIPASQIQVQLPCQEELYYRGVPTVTEVLEHGKVLSWAPSDIPEHVPFMKIDLRGFYIRAVALRSRLLKYVHALTVNSTPWHPDSEFRDLAKDLDVLMTTLPPHARMTRQNVAEYKATNRLGLFFALHVLLSQAHVALYRVGVDGLALHNPSIPAIRAAAPADFLKMCEDVCLGQAVKGSQLMNELKVTDQMSLIDIIYAWHSHDLTRAICLALGSKPATEEQRQALESNIENIALLRPFMNVEDYYETAVKMRNTQLERVKMHDSANDGAQGTSGQQPPPQYSLEYILNPLGTFRFARSSAEEKHAPETRRHQLRKINSAETPLFSFNDGLMDEIISAPDLSNYFDSFFPTYDGP